MCERGPQTVNWQSSVDVKASPRLISVTANIGLLGLNYQVAYALDNAINKS